MKPIKILILLAGIIFLSAGCNIFGGTTVVAGVVKSVNGGADWQFSNAIKGSTTATLVNSSISKLAFDPQNRQTVYAGSFTDGLYKSEDAGVSWTNILSKILVYNFVINPGNSKIIYAAGMYSSQGKVLKTTDGGATWQEVYNEASADNPVRAIALNQASANQLVIGTGTGNLIKSSDEGLSWKLLVNFDDQINRVFWQPDGIYVLLKDKGLFKSDSSGDNFTELTASIAKATENDYGFASQLTYNQVYIDNGSSGLLYVTTSRGVYKSADSGQTWALMALPVQQSASVARAIAVAPSSNNTIYTSVGAVIYKSTDGGNTWQTQSVNTNGLIYYILIDPQLPQIVYAGIYINQ